MNDLTRRGAIGLGVMSGSSILAALARTEAAEEKAVIFADENAVRFKIKDVTLERVDEAERTVAARFGGQDKPLTMTNLSLAKNITIRVSYVEPGSVNYAPFDWERLKGLVGKRVSMMLRAESGGLSVDSFATAND